jgi:hypothetical protein
MKLNEKGSESHDSLEAEYPSMQNIGTLLSYLNVYLHVTPWVTLDHTIPVTCDTAPVTGTGYAGAGLNHGSCYFTTVSSIPRHRHTIAITKGLYIL